MGGIPRHPSAIMCGEWGEWGEQEKEKMAKLLDVIQAVRPDIEGTDIISRSKWDLLCAEKITSDRSQAAFLWRCMIEAGIFTTVNGKLWQIHHEKIFDVIARNNPSNGVVEV